MISRKHRFHGHASLGYVYKNGKVVRTQAMALKFVGNEKRKSYRLAVVVSKKVQKSAVKRNRIRRRIYEQIRQQLNEKVTNTDMVVTVFSDALLAMPSEQLSENIHSLLSQAKIID